MLLLVKYQVKFLLSGDILILIHAKQAKALLDSWTLSFKWILVFQKTASSSLLGCLVEACDFWGAQEREVL